MRLNNFVEKRFIGIDGGGTQTTCIIGDRYGRILATGHGPSSNTKSNPWKTVQTTLLTLIDNVLKSSKTEKVQIQGICLGLAGAGRTEDVQRIINLLSPLFPNQTVLTIRIDAMTALLAGTWGEPGIILISGTGSIACAYNPNNNEYIRVGGWGYLLGDEGSGYDIGRKGLSAVLKEYDGQGEKTRLTPILLEKLGLSSPEDIIINVYEQADARKRIADLSKIIFNAAQEGDKVSDKILTGSIQDLTFLVKTVFSRLSEPNLIKHLVLSGGIFNNQYFLDCFREQKWIKSQKLHVKHLTLAPVTGAYLLVLQQSGIILTEEIKTLMRNTIDEK